MDYDQPLFSPSTRVFPDSRTVRNTVENNLRGEKEGKNEGREERNE